MGITCVVSFVNNDKPFSILHRLGLAQISFIAYFAKKWTQSIPIFFVDKDSQK